MFGKTSHVSPLESRKRLLTAESELNRALLSEEWQELTRGVRHLACRAKTIAVWASSTAVLVAGLRALRRGPPAPGAARSSWFQKILRVASEAWAIWLAFRPRSEEEEHK
jgi:hypothetical protein